MHRAEIEKLIAEGVALFLLGEDVLQCEREFAESGRFRPGAFLLVVRDKFDVGEETAATMRAFFEAGLKLLGEDAAQCVELIGFDCVVGSINRARNRWSWTGAKAPSF